MNNTSLLKFTRANGTSHVVGDFFEDLVRKVLCAEMCEPSHGDFVSFSEPAFVGEVKASDNVHAFRIPKNQFDHQARQLGFLYSHQLFVLCKYINRQGRRRGQMRRSIIKRLHTKEKICGYLAQSSPRIHILHRSVVEALEKRFYMQGRFPVGLDQEPCIEIRHKTLERFCHPTGYKKWLRELGLKGFKSHSFCLKLPYSSGFLKFETRLTITTVLPSKFSAKMYRALFDPHAGKHKMAAAA